MAAEEAIGGEFCRLVAFLTSTLINQKLVIKTQLVDRY